MTECNLKKCPLLIGAQIRLQDESKEENALLECLKKESKKWYGTGKRITGL